MPVSGSTYINYTLKDGLPSLETYDVFEDSKGYIWISTDRGVAKYDGYDFKVYTTDDGLLDNTVYWITEDYKGRIWFVLRTGTLHYLENGVFKEYKFNDVLKRETIENRTVLYITDLFIDSNDLISVCTSRFPKSFHIDSTGQMKKRTKEDWSEIHKNNQKGLKSRISRYQSVRNCAPYDYLEGFSKLKQSIFEAKIDEKYSCVFEQDGAFIVENESHKVVKRLLKGVWCDGFTIDREGNYWISTLTNGVFYFPNKKIEVLYSDDALDDRLFSVFNSTTDTLWFLRHSRKGVNYFDLKSGSVGTINNNIWPEARLRTLLNINSEQTIRFEYFGKLYRSNQMLLLDENKLVFLLPYGSLVNYIHQRDSTCKLSLSCFLRTPYSSFCYNNKKELLISDAVGLRKLVLETGELILVNDHPKLKSRVDSFVQLNDSTYIFASRGKGVVVLAGDSISRFTTSDGLLSNTNNQIIKGIKPNSFYLASNKGINEVFLDKNRIEVRNVLTKYDGLNYNNIYNVFIRSGALYFVTDQLLGKIALKDVYQERKRPLLYLDKVMFNGKEDEISTTYEVDYTSSEFEIRLTGLSFRSLGDLEYFYQLSGVDNDWHSTYQRNIRYTSLDPGEYELRVKALSKDGMFSEEKKIMLTIHPAFWMTWWFKLLIVLMVLGLTMFYFRWQSRKKIEELEQGQLLNVFHQQSLKLQMNPHFIFNTLNSIQYSITRMDKFKASQLLTNFSKLIRYTLKTSTVQKISLEEELEYIKNYVDLEREKLEFGLDFEVDLSQTSERERIMIPPIMIQPLVENAIWHGISPLKRRGKIEILVFKENDSLICQIKDDGVGHPEKRKTKRRQSEELPSIALKNIVSRIKLLEQIEGKKYTFSLKANSKNGQQLPGTIAELTFPI